MRTVRDFIRKIRTEGKRRDTRVTTVAMGRKRVFDAYDIGRDTFILERGIYGHLHERPSVLLVAKNDLRGKALGRIMTVTTGNHSVAAFPLLDGRFWGLSNLPSAKRSQTLTERIVCANIVDGRIEISQRETTTDLLVETDEWLLKTVGFELDAIVMVERNDKTIEHYHRVGQEWRVKPLAWTQNEMRVALAASCKHIATTISYYHSARGVHLLSYAEFLRLAALARTDRKAFVEGLRELVSVFEGNSCSFTRMPKYRGHHEIEFFGLQRGVALERLIPELEKLMEAIELGRLDWRGAADRIDDISRLYYSLLTKPDLADETSRTFVETIYIYVTGEIYYVVGEGSTPAFDDRRTALPGATFVNGEQVMHPGADSRTEVLMSNLRDLMSKDEIVEYANVYELRNDDDCVALGRGATREIVYKTSRRPLENAMVEKRLSHSSDGYSGYMLARIGAMRALGISLSEYYMMLRRSAPCSSKQCDFYIRRRCEGEPMDAIPVSYFRSSEKDSSEDHDVVLRLAQLMGDVAAQNLAMKKYDPKRESALFGIGKEIYAFEYDIDRKRMLPKSVSTCSMRGTFGWPNFDHSDENFRAMVSFYMGSYAHALRDFARRHSVAMSAISRRFFAGFAYRTKALAWHLSVMRDDFERFNPALPGAYRFVKKWHFAMWSLERQERDLPMIKSIFFAKLGEVLSNEEMK